VLGETGDGDVEVIAIVFADMANEVNTVNEPILNCFPLVLATGWVTTKGKDVTTTSLLCILVYTSTLADARCMDP
jgi:hypothetical protein